MKRSIFLSNTDLTVSIENSIGLSTFTDYEPVFTLSKKGKDSFALHFSPALSNHFDVSESSPVEAAQSIISTLTKNDATEMHKLLKKFVGGYETPHPFTIEYTSSGASLSNETVELKDHAAPAPR